MPALLETDSVFAQLDEDSMSVLFYLVMIFFCLFIIFLVLFTYVRLNATHTRGWELELINSYCRESKSLPYSVEWAGLSFMESQEYVRMGS